MRILNQDNLYSSSKTVSTIHFGFGSINKLQSILDEKIKDSNKAFPLFFVDVFFKRNLFFKKIVKYSGKYKVVFINTNSEPTTSKIDEIVNNLKLKNILPNIIVGIGGGSVLDTAKAVSNMLTNSGNSSNFQGWDLLKKPGVYKIGIPTISGTGAESTRTCVLIDKKKKIKLGMNSDYTLFDEVILDPNLTATVPKNQFFYTGMDTFIHCIESLNGSHRNLLSDSLSEQALDLATSCFSSEDMQDNNSREKLMIASFLGGQAISMSFVGLIHPLSAAISVVYGTHHCLANCIVMRAMEEYYPKEYDFFWKLVKEKKIKIPRNILNNIDKKIEKLVNSTLIHEKPLKNALGDNFKKHLSVDKLTELFKMM